MSIRCPDVILSQGARIYVLCVFIFSMWQTLLFHVVQWELPNLRISWAKSLNHLSTRCELEISRFVWCGQSLTYMIRCCCNGFSGQWQCVILVPSTLLTWFQENLPRTETLFLMCCQILDTNGTFSYHRSDCTPPLRALRTRSSFFACRNVWNATLTFLVWEDCYYPHSVLHIFR